MSVIKNDVAMVLTADTAPLLQVFAASGNLLPLIEPTGANIRYGVNSIPTAVIDVTPKELPIICDFETWRRTPVNLKVASKNGCLNFTGLLDGVSLAQGFGDLRMQLIIKNPFQVLMEINPKLLGYHSAGIDWTKRAQVLQVDGSGQDAASYAVAIGAQLAKLQDLPLLEGLIAVFKGVLQSQIAWVRVQTVIGLDAAAAVQAASAMSKQHLQAGLLLLDRIDTSFVKSGLKLGDFFAMNAVLQAIAESRSNLWEMLVTLLDAVGCSLVVAKDKAYVVPSTGFLRQSHRVTINPGEQSSAPNVFFPSQYASVSFNDNGYRDVRGVYLQADEKYTMGIDGFFEDKVTGGKGGILGETLPELLRYTVNAIATVPTNPAFRSAGSGTTPNTKAVTKPPGQSEEQQQQVIADDDAEEKKKEQEVQARHNAQNQYHMDRAKKLMDDYAQLRYLQLKYTDRMGGIVMEFNPQMAAPGTLGSAYLRYPGVYVDYFVTDVTHQIQLSVPDHGVATTSVGFNGGRIGAYYSTPLSAGLEQFSWFEGFDAGTSARVALAFTQNLL